MSLQSKIQEYEQLQQNLKHLEMYREGVASSIREITTAQETLKELKKSEKGEDILFPLGAGIFSFGSLKNKSEVLASIGGGAIVKRDIKGASEILENRKKEQEEILSMMDEQTRENHEKLQKVVREIQELQKEGKD